MKRLSENQTMYSLDNEDSKSNLKDMMASYFMEYASYVIKDRAIPDINDGLKPVQRRILHSLWEIDDGSFHKVANIVGNTMKYHPHGDASIYSALVHLANKDYLIEKQGNFGNIYTGDPASAARYIECRLSPLAKRTVFYPEITAYQESYDGRNQEPITLPAKLPLLLLQGVEGIAVGMATRSLPHNFVELLQAQIAILKGQDFMLYPDFLQGGSMDVSQYQDGAGKIRIRARIDRLTEKTLIIREIPPSCTTESLINSIEDAANKGKVKISGINDYTAEQVEIEIILPRGSYADHVLDALYAYTDCEVTINSNIMLIRDNHPTQMTSSEILRYNTQKLLADLKMELNLERRKLEDQYHAKGLMQLFIEYRIYQCIEACENEEAIHHEVRSGLAPYVSTLRRSNITDEEVQYLLQIPIRRISRFDRQKNKAELEGILNRITKLDQQLARLEQYAIRYLRRLIKDYGKLYPRRTRITDLDKINVRDVALSNLKVGFDRAGGYVGTVIKSDTPFICTEFDRLLVLKWDGTYQVIPIPEKRYIASVCAVFKLNKKQVYSMIYRNRKTGQMYAKRFRIEKFILERSYQSTPDDTKVEKLFSRQNVVVRCQFAENKRQKQDHCEVEFDAIPIRSATAKGYKIASKSIVKFIQLKRGTEQGEDENGA